MFDKLYAGVSRFSLNHRKAQLNSWKVRFVMGAWVRRTVRVDGKWPIFGTGQQQQKIHQNTTLH